MSTIVVKVKPSNDDKDLRLQKKQYLFETAMSVKDGKYENTVMKNHLFRTNVEVDGDKIDTYIAKVKSYTDSLKCKEFNKAYKTVKRARILRTLNEDFGVSGLVHPDKESIYCLSDKPHKLAIRGIIQELVASNGGKYVFTDKLTGDKVTITEEDLDAYSKVLRLTGNLNRLFKLQNELNTRDYLPINFTTNEFIKHKEGYSLIELRLDATNQKRTRLSLALLGVLQSALYELDVDIVDYEMSKSSVMFNLYCKNELVEDVLSKLEESYRSMEVELHENDFNFDIDITYEIGQENSRSEWYYVFSGTCYDEVEKVFRETGESFLGYRVLV